VEKTVFKDFFIIPDGDWRKDLSNYIYSLPDFENIKKVSITFDDMVEESFSSLEKFEIYPETYEVFRNSCRSKFKVSIESLRTQYQNKEDQQKYSDAVGTLENIVFLDLTSTREAILKCVEEICNI
jgi:hypothetical protein